MTEPTKKKTPPFRPPPTGARGSWLAAQGRLPLAFMGLALAWLIVATGMLAFRPGLLGAPHMTPAVIALTHAWILGFFVTVACGAVYQIVPVALSTTLWNERLGWMHFSLHAVGVPGMVIFFEGYQLRGVVLFAIATALGVIFFAWNVWVTVLRSSRRDVVAQAIVLAAGWLALTVLAGLFIALNRLGALVPGDPLPLLRAHAHLGLIGFFITLLQGVAFQLVPMFTMGEVRRWRPVETSLWLSQSGLIILAPSLILQWAWPAFVGALAITASLLLSGYALKHSLLTRKKRRLDPGVVAFLSGWAGLCVAALAGTCLLRPGTQAGMATHGFSPMVYAILAIFLGLLPCVAGMMCKVVPFLTWMRTYGPKVGRAPTPPAHSLTHPRLERVGLTLQQVSALPLVVGAWQGSIPWLATGVGLLALGVLLFLLDMLGVLKHLWFPVTSAPLPHNAQPANLQAKKQP